MDVKIEVEKLKEEMKTLKVDMKGGHENIQGVIQEEVRSLREAIQILVVTTVESVVTQNGLPIILNHPSGSPQLPQTVESERRCAIPVHPDQEQPVGAEGYSGELQLNQQDPPTEEIQIWNVILSFKKSFELFLQYLGHKLNVFVRSHDVGSLLITVECSSLQILEGLWEDYCSGHLNKVAQEMLITPQVLMKVGLRDVTLKTFISEDEYEKGKRILKDNSGPAGRLPSMALSPLRTVTNYEEFNVFLIKIADEITEEEVRKMKFLCMEPNSNLPRGKLDPKKEPREFLNFLRKRGKIWPEDVTYLIWLLENVGNIQLAAYIRERGPPSSPGCNPVILPCQTTHFIGRGADVDKIITKLRTDAMRMIVLVSLPGMGKTQVAIRVSHVLQDRGDLSVMFIERQKKLTDICGEILDRLSSRRWSASVDLVSQAKRKLSELQEDTVIVLDNTEDVQGKDFDDFAEWLVKFAPIAQLIITTRQDVGFVSPDIHKVHLDPLDAKSSAKLLQKLVTICSEEHAKELGERCGGIPLLLINCADLLNDDFSPEVLIQLLRDNPIQLLRTNATVVYDALGMFIKKFSEDVIRNLVLMSVFPSTFTAEDIQFLFEDQLQLQTVKTMMVKCALLQKANDRQISIHPLVQAYCRAERESLNMVDAGRAAERKFNNHYLELLQSLSKKFIRNNAALVAILTFREQKVNIMEALKNCFEDTIDVDQKGLAIDIANSTEVLDFLAKVLSPPKDCTKLYRKCCDIAKTSGDKKRHADSLNSLGFRRLCDVSHSKDDRQSSRATLEMFQEAHDIRRTLPEEEQKCQTHAHTVSKLGVCHVLQGEEGKGRSLIQEGISMRKDLGAALYVAAGHCDLGNTYRLCDDHQTAIKIWEMNTLPVYEQELGDHPWTASILHYIGDSYKALAIGNSEHGYAEQAEEYFRRALELRRKLLGVHQDTARSHVFLSDVLVIRGEFQSALEELEKALLVQKDILGPQHKITADTLNKITDVLAKLDAKARQRKDGKR